MVRCLGVVVFACVFFFFPVRVCFDYALLCDVVWSVIFDCVLSVWCVEYVCVFVCDLVCDGEWCVCVVFCVFVCDVKHVCCVSALLCDVVCRGFVCVVCVCCCCCLLVFHVFVCSVCYYLCGVAWLMRCGLIRCVLCALC